MGTRHEAYYCYGDVAAKYGCEKTGDTNTICC
jgi:hypothetical protein